MKLFDIARLKLTTWYVVVITLVSITFSLTIYRVEVVEITRIVSSQHKRIERQFGPGFELIEKSVIEDAKKRIVTRLIMFNGIVMLLSGGLGYFLAGRTLIPIEEMVRRQRRFISDAAHELRTPISAMKVSLEVFARDKRPKLSEAKEVLLGNAKDLSRLESLTESLLTLSELEEGGGTRNFEEVDMGEVAEVALQAVTPQTKIRQIKLVSEITPVSIYGNYQHLVDLTTILLDNAVKYSPKKSGKVKLLISARASKMKLVVQDNGIGIAGQDLPHIFDRFYRSDSARIRREKGGYGLGLAIAKKIVVSHSGTIRVDSRVGKGTKFTIWIPLSSA